jgi:hypothetical protein
MKYDTPRHRAIAAGLKRYEGLPCINCGGTERFVSNQACVPCRQAKKYAYNKKRRLLNKPKKIPLTAEQIIQKQQDRRDYDRAYSARPERLGFRRAKKAKYRCDVLKRTPKWLTAKDRKDIRAIYDEAANKTMATGIQHHIDHIIPLRGRYVSGLHVPNNLQILLAEDNLKKRADYEVN